MQATLVFVPPGGGEVDYSLDFELPSVPQLGAYISIRRSDERTTEDFIVRRTWWHLGYPDTGFARPSEAPPVYGSVRDITVECEFAVGPYSKENHRRACDRYEILTGERREFDTTAY